MTGDSLIPISKEQAEALTEAIKALRGMGSFLEKTFGTVPEDLVGLLGGDWLRVKRAENLARIAEKARERLESRGVEEPQAASLSITLPIFVAAADESRDELQDLWAKLLAAAADPSRSSRFRIAFIETVKKMDPMDAMILDVADSKVSGKFEENSRRQLATELKITRDELAVSEWNLEKLGLAESAPSVGHRRYVTPFGREFLRVVRD